MPAARNDIARPRHPVESAVCDHPGPLVPRLARRGPGGGPL